MILLPVFGLAVGFLLARRAAFVVTLAAALVGFSLVAALTGEVDGWYDPFVWIDTLVGTMTTGLGILLRFLWQGRTAPERSLVRP